MSERTVTTIACIVIAFYCAIFANAIGKPGGVVIDDKGRPAVVDYVAMWTAGKLTLEGRPELAYDPDAHKAAQDRVLGFDTGSTFPWAYPPPYFAVVAVFSLLPYLVSLAVFTMATLALYSLINARIVGRPVAAVWMTATAATFWCVSMGQNAMLNAALLGAGLLAIPTRPLLAGVLIGLLSYKPHIGLLIPLALAAAGLWRTFAAAAATTLVLALASIALFGVSAWGQFFAAISEFGGLVLSQEYERVHRLQSLFGFLRTFGVLPAAALAAQIALALALAATVVWTWRRPLAHEIKAAVLVTAAVMASPYMFIYDIAVLTIAQAFLLRHMLATGVTPARVAPLVAANMLVLAFPLLKIPTGFLAAVVTGLVIAAEAGLLRVMAAAMTARLAGISRAPF